MPRRVIAYKMLGGIFECAASGRCDVASSSFRSPGFPLRPTCLAAGAVAVGLFAAGADGAEARTYRQPAKRVALEVPTKPARAAGPTVKPKGEPPRVHLIVVSIPRQRITVHGAGGFRTESAVSTGMRGFPTPTGVFSVIQKNKYHRSNIYSGAPMPFMQRITWSGVAMHAGVLPGYPASHGCIRLTHAFASELWTMTRLGTRVVVAPEDVQAVEVAHPALPKPLLAPAPAPVAAGDAPAPTLVSAGGGGSETERPAAGGLLGPLERARLERARIVAEAPDLARAAKEAGLASAAKAVAANKAIAALRAAEQALADARARHEAAVKAAEAAKDGEAAERAKADETAAAAKLAEAAKAAEEAAAAETAATREAFAAAQAAWDAEKRSDAAAAVVRAGERSLEPVSVFVSRKTGRVYVRQAWKPIHEAPVTFKNPDEPIGTHTYVAMDPIEEGRAMRWLSVSLAPAPHAAEPRQRKGRDRGSEAAPRSAPPRISAAAALERFELPEETRKLIADRLWAGATLTVSDQGLSHETGKYTDFIVLTR